jgi:chromosome segregation ATPase
MTLSEQIKSGFEDLKAVFSKAPVALAGFEELQANFETAKTDLASTQAKLSQAESDLATAKASIVSLTAEKDKAVSDLAVAKSQVEALPIQIKQAASAQAAVITASIGVPPVQATVKTDEAPKSFAERAVAAALEKANQRK